MLTLQGARAERSTHEAARWRRAAGRSRLRDRRPALGASASSSAAAPRDPQRSDVGRVVARKAEAEDRLAALIGSGGDVPGRLGLVWVRQQRTLEPLAIDTDFESGKPRERGERAALMQVIGEEIGAADRGGQFEAVRRKTRDALDQLYTTKRNGPKKNGPLELALRRNESLKIDVEDARRASLASEDRLRRIAAVAERLSSLTAPDVDSRERQALGELEKAAAAADGQRARHAQLQEMAAARKSAHVGAVQSAKAAARLGETYKAKLQARDSARDLSARIKETAGALNAEACTPALIERLLTLEREHRLALAELAGVSATVDLALEGGAAGKVRVDGEPAPAGGARIAVPGRLTIDIEGIGRIAVTSGGADQAAALLKRRDAAQRGMQEILSATGAATIAEAQDKAKARAALVEALERDRAQLSGLAPQGLTELEQECALVEGEHRSAEATRQSGDRIAELAAEAAAAEAALANSASGAMSDEVYRALTGKLAAARAAAKRRHDDIGELELALANLKGEQAGADEDGKAAKVSTLEGEWERETAEAERLDHEAKALRLLEETLADIEARSRAAVFAPVSARLGPMLAAIFGPSQLGFRDDFALAHFDRQGTREPFVSLSDGTREQLSVLVRLAYAELLADRGAPAPVILDDPFVYSDDVRLAALIDVIARASKIPQVLLLTCRAQSFRNLPGRRLEIEDWRPGG